MTDEQVDYYSRQIILPELGGTGQRRLLSASALLSGHGAAFDAARTYLVGSGVGRVDVCGPPAPTLHFAEATDRNPDVATLVVPVNTDRSVYDLHLDFGTTAPSDSAGFPRRGEIGWRRRPQASEILVVPRESGCLACCGTGGTSSGAAGGDDDGPALLANSMAGAMAALAAILWLAEIALPRGPRLLCLLDQSPTWSETTTERTPRCPRSCRA